MWLKQCIFQLMWATEVRVSITAIPPQQLAEPSQATTDMNQMDSNGKWCSHKNSCVTCAAICKGLLNVNRHVLAPWRATQLLRNVNRKLFWPTLRKHSRGLRSPVLNRWCWTALCLCALHNPSMQDILQHLTTYESCRSAGAKSLDLTTPAGYFKWTSPSTSTSSVNPIKIQVFPNTKWSPVLKNWESRSDYETVFG